MGRRRNELIFLVGFVTAFILLYRWSPKPEPMPALMKVPAGDTTLHGPWSLVDLQYPVDDITPLPTNTDSKSIPRIQHRFTQKESEEDRKIRQQRLDTVKSEFLHAWNGYKQNAWLSDEVAPVSGGKRTNFGGWAATLVDSLDTLWIMGLKDEFNEAVDAVAELDFTVCALEVLNIFETTIRYLGAFLAAYDLSGHPVLLQKAREVGAMIYVAFDTPNHMPVTRWHFMAAVTGARSSASNQAFSAELGSFSLEFTRLAQLTGDDRFYDAVHRIMSVFEDQQQKTKLPGLWPVFIDARHLDFTSGTAFGIGGMADSLYEYLPKQHLLLGGAVKSYSKMFSRAGTAIKKNLLYKPMTPTDEDILFPGDVSSTGMAPASLNPRNQHLTCFAGGMFGLAGKIFDQPEDVEIGRQLTDGCLWAYEVNPHGIMPEIMYTLPCKSRSSCSWDQEKWQKEISHRHHEDPDWKSIVKSWHLKKGITKIEDPQYALR
jgi:mannosyl-oligosaccharide alpha-1,2-mannosidase